MIWLWVESFDAWFGPYPDDDDVIRERVDYFSTLYGDIPIRQIADSPLVRRRVANDDARITQAMEDMT